MLFELRCSCVAADILPRAGPSPAGITQVLLEGSRMLDGFRLSFISALFVVFSKFPFCILYFQNTFKGGL